MNVTVEVVVNR